MKLVYKALDVMDAGSMIGRLDPIVALLQIRRATRPGIMRVQKKWKRRAMYRRWGLRVEWVLLRVIGTVGVVLAVMSVVSFLNVVYQGIFR